MGQTRNHKYYLEVLNKKVLIFDGAMGTSLQNQNLTDADFGGSKYAGCNDYLVISRPEAIQKVHDSFLKIGVDVVETCTFRSNRLTLGEYDLQDRVIEINTKAAQIARDLADKYSTTDKPRFVAGSIGPSGKLPSMDDPDLSNIAFDELSEIFEEQATGLINGGADLILLETQQDILEVKAAVIGIQNAFQKLNKFLPLQVQITLDTTGRMLLGTDIESALTTLVGMPIDIFGINCSTGPEHMRETIKFLSENSPLPISCLPNAGLPINVDGEAIYPLEPNEFADYMVEFATAYNVSCVGGCCGTTPDHLSALINQLGERIQTKRDIKIKPALSSSINSTSMYQEPAPFLIGERLNTQGSRKFKKLILEEDYESIHHIAQVQIDKGAHALDICVALTEQTDESARMKKIIELLRSSYPTPFVIDTTEIPIMETALQTAPGKCLINSTHLEGGREKLDKVLSLAKRYNTAVIILTIDEQGMAKTTNRKFEIAKRIYDIATTQFGLDAGNLVFDTLTFSLATGDPELNDSAINTLEAIRKIKTELPGVLTSLGISNVSFGLKPNARKVLNSIMLFHAVKAGLDMAIVNPAQNVPYSEIPEDVKKLTEDLIFNKTPDALQNFIEFFESSDTPTFNDPDQQESILNKMSPPERLQWKIVHRSKENIEADIDEIVNNVNDSDKHQTAINTLNNTLLPAMKEVGDKFGSGELILPYVLQSAEVMKCAVNHLEKYLDKKEGASKGTIILATVYGDVHDIGKNLVKTILSNNGYTVIDLGKQVPAEIILSKASEYNADAIGLSALLVSTSKQMPLIVNELERRGMNIPVLIGGAAINKKFGKRILKTEQNNFYKSGVFYCKDAFDGLNYLNTLNNPEERSTLLDQIQFEAKKEYENEIELSDSSNGYEESSNVTKASFIPQHPKKWGYRTVKEMPLDEIFTYLSKKDLFRLSWGAKNKRGTEWEALEKEYEDKLIELRQRAINEKWLTPQAIYGYWPTQSDKNDLIIYDPETINSKTPAELCKFSFPRQKSNDKLCIADYFAKQDSGIIDVVAFQIVTVGHKATELINELQDKEKYGLSYYIHGLAAQIAEATAEYLHQFIRKELGLNKDQGKRYSWGYPSLPDISDHQKLFSLLPAEKELGMQLTSAFQFIPEQSTAAIIVHHPDAKYFTTGISRTQQLLEE